MCASALRLRMTSGGGATDHLPIAPAGHPQKEAAQVIRFRGPRRSSHPI
eukprot:CAMPEP_0174381128 /NCGR_PEP_ID=MMETSP0811_2-20130205/123810_1 /TAXON_ID=73025 ORGANISM="Eutreptiella gymnastica-like, Strain CCMP1594" /NCGR_SAMPLE_ID=MMETSP0811_2 /ASSEMBLY_ACC=CAM_ASM_000667 /LENGTH=48 /DNA_ID= /DNA_START= /DNA_END= /DNA_ORIENTATION=